MEEYSVPRGMKQIGDLFEKYKTRLKVPQASVEKECIVVIKEVTGFELTREQVSYTVSTRVIHLQIPSVLKSELRFHQAAILEQLKHRLGKDGCPNAIL